MTPDAQTAKIEQLTAENKQIKEDFSRRIADLKEEIRRDLEAIQRKESEFRKEMYERMRLAEETNARTDEKYKSIMSELSEQKAALTRIMTKLEDIGDKPAKRWENVVGTIISGIVMAFVGLILGKGL